MTPRRLLRRFISERRGAVALEFVALAVPFFLLLFAIVECCIAFAAQELMTNATDDIARQFRTGQLKASQIGREELRKLLCEKMRPVFPANCMQLEIDLRSFGSFDEAAEIFATGVVPAEYRYEPGPALSKNVLRVFYPWPVFTDILRRSMSNLPGGKTLLFATTAWQNEPFDE